MHLNIENNKLPVITDREFLSSEIQEVIEAESVSLFDAKPGTELHLDLSFDEDGQKVGKLKLRVDRSADRDSWDRGAFTVMGAALSFGIGNLIGKTGRIDSAITYRKDYMPPFTSASIARITKGRDLIINFDIPSKPDKINRWIPFVLDCSVSSLDSASQPE